MANLAAFTAAVQEQNANQLLPNIQALQCRLALYSGDAAGVANWLNKAPNEDKEFCVLERYRYLTKVRCYIARGEHLRALALLEKLHYYAEICKRPYVNMECGLLTAKIPGLDCVSIGPDMADVHTTEESFSIESVARMWDYLLAVLAEKQQDR